MVEVESCSAVRFRQNCHGIVASRGRQHLLDTQACLAPFCALR
jgi:hypothetical protein